MHRLKTCATINFLAPSPSLDRGGLFLFIGNQLSAVSFQPRPRIGWGDLYSVPKDFSYVPLTLAPSGRPPIFEPFSPPNLRAIEVENTLGKGRRFTVIPPRIQ